MRLIFFILLLLLLLSSCTKEIEVILPEEDPSLVVQATLYPQIQNSTKKLALEVQSTLLMDDTARVRYVKDALVLYYENNQLRDTLDYSDSLKKYILANNPSEYPVKGSTYSIVVQKHGYTTVKGDAFIPEIVPLSKIEVLPIAYLDENHSAYSEVTMYFTDPVMQNNFYEIIAIDGYSKNDEGYELSTNDKLITGESYYPALLELKNNRPNFLLFKDTGVQGRHVELKIYYIPPQVIKGPEGKRYIAQHMLNVYLRNVSEEYYRYKTTYIEHVDKNSENILYGQSEPMNVYSNIENGYGIFAGYNYSIQSANIPETEIK